MRRNHHGDHALTDTDKDAILRAATAVLDVHPEVADDMVDFHHLVCRKLGRWVSFDTFRAFVRATR